MTESTDSIDLLQGTINRFLFQDNESGYVVFVLDLTPSSSKSSSLTSITVKGSLPPLQPGQEVELQGQWIFDPKYGRQFAAASCRGSLPATITGLKRFLGSGLIKGIGKEYAERLVRHFGIQVLKIIEEHPERLAQVEGIGAKRIQTIVAGWKEHKEIADIMVFLQDKGISPALAARIYKQYRHQTIPLLMQNPYKIAEEVWGIGFKLADQVARKMGFALDSPQRVRAGILYGLLTGTQQGHLYSEIQELKQTVLTLLELDQGSSDSAARLKQELHGLYEQGAIKVVSKEDKHFLGLTKSYNAEQGIARKITQLLQRATTLNCATDKEYITQLYTQLTTQAQTISLNEKQIEGILTCLQHKVTIITGGPGTGKTTLIKELLRILDTARVQYKLAAPTGRAAKRITQSTGKPAATLHRLLEFDPANMGFQYNERNTLTLDFLIIDEASMIDVFLAHALLKAVPVTCHVLFIGDVDQLPSVGAGNFLNDCITSALVPCVRLTEVFRQAQDSLIIVNAHRVNKGEYPVSFLPEARRDFMFIKETDSTQLAHHLKRLFFVELPKYSINRDDAQVLTPMNRGNSGTQVLNHYLQSLLNNQVTDQVIFQGTTYKVGDRVMQIRNNYDKFVFNGDCGVIITISTQDRALEVLFGERTVTYEFHELNELVLAYAITVHKSQGSEYQAVIIPLFMQHYTLLQRNLLYTAITRARNLCVLIGEPRAIGMAIKNAKSIQRLTFLATFLQEQNSSNEQP